MRLLDDNDVGHAANDDQAAAKTVGQRQNVRRGRRGEIHHLEQQHHRRGIAHQIGQRRRRQRQIGRRVEIKAALRQPVDGLFAAAGGFKRAGDHKQAHEEHQDRPLHQSEQILGAKFGAGQMNAGCRQRNDFLRQRREEQTDDHDENNDSLESMRPVEGIGLLRQSSLNGQRSLKIFPREQPDNAVGGGHGEQHGHAAPEQVAAKIQVRNLANHHVLRIANHRGRRADIAGNGQRDQKRHRIDLLAQQRHARDWRKHETNNVVIQERGQPAGHEHQDQKKPRRMTKLTSETLRHQVIEPRQPELGGDDKKSKQQANRRPVDIRNGGGGGDAAENHQANRPQQGDARTIELQTGNMSDRDPDIGHGEDRQDDFDRLHSCCPPPYALPSAHANQIRPAGACPADLSRRNKAETSVPCLPVSAFRILAFIFP